MKIKLSVIIYLFVLFAQGSAFAGDGLAAVNIRVLRAFRDAFPLAERVEWRGNGDHYFVNFKENAILSEVEYDHEGNFIRSERFFKSVNLLPRHLSREIHKKFPDKTVFGITETKTDAEIHYYVKLEDDKEWMTVKGSVDGNVLLVEKFYKQL